MTSFYFKEWRYLPTNELGTGIDIYHFIKYNYWFVKWQNLFTNEFSYFTERLCQRMCFIPILTQIFRSTLIVQLNQFNKAIVFYNCKVTRTNFNLRKITLLTSGFPIHRPQNYVIYTQLITDLNQQSEMIIFESLLTTFEASIIYEAAAAVAKMCSRLNQITMIK